MKNTLIICTALFATAVIGSLSYSEFRMSSPNAFLVNGTVVSPEGSSIGMPGAQSRMEWELLRQADPVSGTIPAGVRAAELSYAKTLPQRLEYSRTQAAYSNIGPYNVGGRTRAAAIDRSNENRILAGGISGGMWLSENRGQSWTKVTSDSAHHAVSCIIQDPRPGFADHWYYGSGEGFGNSASKSFSATYSGDGIYHSTDGGYTWNVLPSTQTGDPQTSQEWDFIWRIVVDPTRTDSTIIYAAAAGIVYRSNDAGSTWQSVLGSQGGNSSFAEVAITSTGVLYATLGDDGNSGGIYRSTDGLNWTSIFSQNIFLFRTVIGIDPSNENKIYFLAHTPIHGFSFESFRGAIERNSLWRYSYNSGDGSGNGGTWQTLSDKMANGRGPSDNFIAQSGYNLVIQVHPQDSNRIFYGGTNLFRTDDGFTTEASSVKIGGYGLNTDIPFYDVWPDHHPDQHVVAFFSNPDSILSCNDGGVFATANGLDQNVVWDNLNRGYLTTQFYTVAVDRETPGSKVVFGGLQDNSTLWTNTDNAQFSWTMPSLGDGSYCYVSNAGQDYYFSRQNGRMIKASLDANGLVTAFRRIDPIGGSNYLFINPFTGDPNDPDLMYLAAGNYLWVNDSLTHIPLTNEYDTISQGWNRIDASNTGGTSITAVHATSNSADHTVYYGTSNRFIFRMDSAHKANPTITNITNNIGNGRYTSCITSDPRDGDKVMVVYSNYNVYSLYYSEDAGNNWQRIAGNLESAPTQGSPPDLAFGTGPSLRWAQILPVSDGTVYLIGTSTGLYATDSLQGDSTVWVQQAPNAIGNVVVDMIDTRVSDGFVAVGTHGRGVFTTYITSVNDILRQPSSIQQHPETQLLGVFPNPAQNIFNVELPASGQSEITVTGMNGQVVHTQTTANTIEQINCSSWPPGVYIVMAKAEHKVQTNRLIVR